MNVADKKNTNDPYVSDSEIDLRELFNVIWEGKKLIILITSFVAICAVIYSLTLTNYYRSESILIPTESQNSTSLSAYSGLGSLAGFSIGSATGDGAHEMIEIIKSRKFTKHLMTFENVVPSLMAVKNYDSSSQELYFDHKIYNTDTKEWTRQPTKNNNSKPSYIETHKAYLSGLSISQDKKTGFISIMFDHISPVFAKDFLTLIIKEANTLKRKKDIETSNKALGYLKEELSRTSLVEIRESISLLIENQLETSMMAKIKEEYSLIIIEPPFIPEEKSKPSRAIIVIIITMLGGILSLMIVLVRYYLLGKEITN